MGLLYTVLVIAVTTLTITAAHPQERLPRNSENESIPRNIENETISRNTESESCQQMEVLRGRDGRDGRDGKSGPVGLPGQKGEQAEKGEQGVPGAQGESVRGEGERGIAGPQGPIGISGPQGAIGEKGLQGSPGLPGSQGEQGAQGPPTGGAVYTRWGRTSCPSGQGTELVYSGRAGGSWYIKTGGASNYLCMPDNPDYLLYGSGNTGRNYLYGVEYDPASNQPFRQQNNNVYAHNAPCAVCFTTLRDTVMMIPAKTECPTSWTTEYIGYLMSQAQHHTHSTMYECVDKEPESVPGLNAVNWGSGSAIFDHVEASCNGMDCNHYDAGKELTCVVCTR